MRNVPNQRRLSATLKHIASMIHWAHNTIISAAYKPMQNTKLLPSNFNTFLSENNSQIQILIHPTHFGMVHS